MQKLRKKGNMPEGFFRKGSNESWRSDLSAAEIQSVEYLLADLMDELAYERVNKGEIVRPAVIKTHNMKKQLKSWFRNTLFFDLLRKIKQRLLG